LRIRILIPLWKRPEVTRFCFDNLFKSDKHEIDVTCVISENEYIDICEEYGFSWVWAENEPVGKKINAGIKSTLKHPYDYLMMMNSDDVIDKKLIDEVYDPFFESLNPYFGINRVTFVNFYTKEARDIVHDGSILGIGKCIRKDVLKKCFDERGEVYRNDLNRGLDDTMMDNLIKCDVWPTMVPYDGQMAWDFKSEVNIHGWGEFKDRGTEVCYSRN
jgi:hypothetical protein